MRIAITADPELPVPPRLYGGIERIVDLLAIGLVNRGHEVTLFANPDSSTAGRLVPWPGVSSESQVDTFRNAAMLAREVTRSRFDIVHSFSRVAYLSALLPFSIPKVMTYQRAVSARSIRWGHALSRGTLSFTAISKWMTHHVEDIGRWDLVPNGVPLDVYGFSPRVPHDAPLVFLGRMEEIKGPHLAIEVAKRCGRRLILAGNIPADKQEWVDEHVLRHVDGDAITYVGPVDDTQKSALLRQAAAFLMPILWDEPFGIVMIEAMACGVPVVGLNRGAVPEIVLDGITGYVCNDINELVAAVTNLDRLDRAACRARVERFYSEDAVVEGYLRVYEARVLGRSGKAVPASDAPVKTPSAIS
jgi:glycosyltransferase involved in cell wall biosynthesis